MVDFHSLFMALNVAALICSHNRIFLRHASRVVPMELVNCHSWNSSSMFNHVESVILASLFDQYFIGRRESFKVEVNVPYLFVEANFCITNFFIWSSCISPTSQEILWFSLRSATSAAAAASTDNLCPGLCRPQF